MRQAVLSVPTEETSSDAVRLDARDPIFRERPHDVLDHLRANDPVHQDQMFDRVVLTRADDIAESLADRDLSTDPFKARPTAHGRRREEERDLATMFTLDDPDHARLRGLVSKAFNARAVEALRGRIETIAAQLLDAIDARKPFDLVTSYAGPLPTLVISAMLGVDDAKIDQFRQWSEDLVFLLSPDRSAQESLRLKAAIEATDDYLAHTLAERRERPRDDLISALAVAEADGDKLTEREIINNCRVILVAGNVTTADLIGNGVVALLRHPEQLARLRAEPDLWPSAVEEMLRYDSSVAHINRQAPTARRIDGCPVEAGQTITVMLLAANHDPALHANPHSFDIGRDHQKHLSFGNGHHFCLGASLARLEAQIGLSALFARFPRLRVAGDLRRKATPTFNGFESVLLDAT